jgi:hypothetical protein
LLFVKHVHVIEVMEIIIHHNIHSKILCDLAIAAS